MCSEPSRGSDPWLARADSLYERAVFGDDAAALDEAGLELDRVEAHLAIARGRLLHASFLAGEQPDDRELVLFERAVELGESLGAVDILAEALFWIGVYHQVVQAQAETALEALVRADALATQIGDRRLRSYIIRHLAFAEADAGRLELVQARLEESVRLRRELEFMPGVAAGLLALAEYMSRTGRPEEAMKLAEEARATAEASEANGIIRWVDELQGRL